MLEPAYYHQEQLHKQCQKFLRPKYKYLNVSSFFNFKLEIKEESWNKEQWVSTNDKNEIVGYFCATLDRDTRNVSSLFIANFTDNSKTFGVDLWRFIKTLKRYRMIYWQVTIGNPIEKSYDKICKRLGGKIVGISKNNVRALDGKLYDVKSYEVENKEYSKNYEGC